MNHNPYGAYETGHGNPANAERHHAAPRRTRQNLPTALGVLALLVALISAITWAAGVDRFGLIAIVTTGAGVLLVAAGQLANPRGPRP